MIYNEKDIVKAAINRMAEGKRITANGVATDVGYCGNIGKGTGKAIREVFDAYKIPYSYTRLVNCECGRRHAVK